MRTGSRQCACPFKTAETLRSGAPLPRSPRKAHAQPGLDRRALRFLLSSRREVLERMAQAPKATGRPSANVSVLWSYYTRSVYKSGDLPAIAVREGLQNGVDAIRSAVKARQIAKGEGRFEVTWDEGSRTLTMADNGIGMSAEDVLERFLSLGTSGKSSAADSNEAAGGFGVAKAVILGTSETFRWTLHTRDNRVVSAGEGKDVEIFDLKPAVQGTILQIFDVAPTHAGDRWDRATRSWLTLKERLRLVLAACDLDDVQLLLNGEPVKRLFSRRQGSRLVVGAEWGKGTTAKVRGLRRSAGDKQGGYWVRLNGLYQFRDASTRGGLPADIVIDIATTVRPGQEGYPLNAARDSFQGAAFDRFHDLQMEVERENQSVGMDEEDEIIEPEGGVGENGDAAAELAALTAEAFEDPELRAALGAAAGGLLDLMEAEEKVPRTSPPADSEAPPSVPRPQGHLTLVPAEAPPEVIRRFLLDVDDRRKAAVGEGESFYPLLDAAVDIALSQVAETGDTSRDGQIKIASAVNAAVAQAQEVGGGGLLQMREIPRVQAAVFSLAPGQKAPPKVENPFAGVAGLRISKRHYDRARARRFKKGWKKWLPHLVVWDGALRLIAAEASIRRAFHPGWVLNDDLTGLAEARRGKAAVVYLHPDRLAEVIQAHNERPMAIAGFLHGVACHELTHLDGRMGQGHDEAFVVAREELGRETAHLLPAIGLLVSKVLKVGPKGEDKALAKLERQVAALREKAKASATAQRALKRAEVALARCQETLAEGRATSAQARERATASCPCGAGLPHAQEPTRGEAASAAAQRLIQLSVRQRNSAGLFEGLMKWMELNPPRGFTAEEVLSIRRRHGEALQTVVAAAMGREP